MYIQIFTWTSPTSMANSDNIRIAIVANEDSLSRIRTTRTCIFLIRNYIFFMSIRGSFFLNQSEIMGLIMVHTAFTSTAQVKIITCFTPPSLAKYIQKKLETRIKQVQIIKITKFYPRIGV